MESTSGDQNSLTRLDLEPQHRLNDLQSAWNEKERHYEEKSGEIEVSGQKYQFKVSFVDLDEAILRTFPTRRRAVTEIGADLRIRPDIALCVFPGWGETSAQFEGDFLDLLLEQLMESGYRNPKIVGVNVSGRGTSEYLAEGNKEKISRIGMMDEVDDTHRMLSVLDGRGYFGQSTEGRTPISLIGHSMGALNAIEAVNVLNSDSLFNNRQQRVERVLNMMPAVDGPFAMINDIRFKFLRAVRKQIIPAANQAWIKKGGYLDIGDDDYYRIMFGDRNFRDDEQRARRVPDSSLRFLQLALNPVERFEHILRSGGTADGVDFTVLRGEKDKLIPYGSVNYLPKIVRDRGMSGRAEVIDLPDLSHSIPFRLRGEQREQIKIALGRFLE